MTDVSATLAQRGSKYGIYKDLAAIAQSMKDAMRRAPGWMSLAPDQRESLDQIAMKIARILNGDPDYDDNWLDIAGYAQLVVKRLHGEPV